jgi:hypothetical protein
MNVYKLDDKVMDDSFLQGQVIRCRAVLSQNELQHDSMKVGSPITIMLSKGKKYKGRVVSFQYLPVQEFAMGEIEIIKESHR